MSRWQEVLHGLAIGPHAVVNPKRIARRLNKAYDYLSDICRRDRVDPLAVFNEILRDAERYAASDQPRFTAVAGAIFPLLISGTHWVVYHYDPSAFAGTELTKLCEHAGVLMQDLGGAIKSLAAVERDGDYDADDDVNIAEFNTKADRLVSQVRAMQNELARRRSGVPR